MISHYWINPEVENSVAHAQTFDPITENSAWRAVAAGYHSSLVSRWWSFTALWEGNAAQPYHPIRLSSRNDGQGTFEKHGRINTTGWQQWSSNLSQRITPWGKGSYQ